MAKVELENLTKVYDDASGTVVAVEELDLAIRDGEFVVIVGPSGCGKSTTLRMIAGLESVTDGEIRIGDRPVSGVPPKDRDIAMVFQNYALYPHKTVRGNMAYGLELSTTLADEEIIKRVKETAAMMGIEELLDKKPAALSGGQQQRVATGRAIVREPEVFLFDEPLSNLDAKLRKHMRTELARLHSELAITSIYVTHDQEEAMTMADRIVILDDGRLQQVGTPKEVYYEPANRFVADFVGSPAMNFFDVRLADRAAGAALVGADLEYAISDGLRSTLEGHDADLSLGIRPENIRVVGSGEADPGKTVGATVDVVETVGSDNFLYLQVGDRECRVRAPFHVEPGGGSRIEITFDEANIHLFDATTEEAIFHGGEAVEAAAWPDSGETRPIAEKD